MSEFIITPSNLELIDWLIKNPNTGRWSIPVLTFNTRIVNPFFGELDPLNNDPRYQQRVIDHFYMRLTEKWLYKDPVFRKLLKYFKITQNGDEGRVLLIDNIDKIPETEPDVKFRKHIFRYIEKYFITRKFVEKALKQYVRKTGVKWYDLINNTDVLKDLFAHKLKKLIESTIYQLEEKK